MERLVIEIGPLRASVTTQAALRSQIITNSISIYLYVFNIISLGNTPLQTLSQPKMEKHTDAVLKGTPTASVSMLPAPEKPSEEGLLPPHSKVI